MRGFNEAEAFTPRIRVHGQMQVHSAPTGFNEAEAFTPRIPELLHRSRPLHEAASMRPRLLHLGSVASESMTCISPMRFNEAEAFTPRIHAN